MLEALLQLQERGLRLLNSTIGQVSHLKVGFVRGHRSEFSSFFAHAARVR